MFEQKPTSQERKMRERLQMRKVYQNLSSLDSAIQYMKSEDFEKGGWFVLAFQAAEIKKIKEDIQFIKNALTQPPKCTSNIVSLPLSDKINVQSSDNSDWVPLQTCCWDWQKEAIAGNYDLVFNPHYIRNLITYDLKGMNALADVIQKVPGASYLFHLRKANFLEKLVLLRKMKKNRPVHKFDINELERFCIERKQKPLPGMCA